MLCQSCGQRPATTHIKSIVNGQLAETHLCAHCAKEQGYSNLLDGSLLGSFGGFGSLLGGLLAGPAAEAAPEAAPQQVKRCPACGASFPEISRSGQMGCAQCYETFRAQLLPVIQRIHGAARHRGKSPGGSALRVTEQNTQLAPAPQPAETPLEEKKRLLKEAVAAQNFAQAAVLRDQIKEMESHG